MKNTKINFNGKSVDYKIETLDKTKNSDKVRKLINELSEWRVTDDEIEELSNNELISIIFMMVRKHCEEEN